MMKNQPSQASTADHAEAKSDDWNALATRIQELAHRRSRSLLNDHDDDAFDRGARSLRTLMSAAEVAARMKREEEKERDTNDSAAEPQITDEQIRALKRKLEDQIARIEEEDRIAAERGDTGASQAASSTELGSERS